MLKRLLTVLLIFFLIGGAGWLSLRRADIPYQTLETVYTSKASEFTNLTDGLKIHYRDEGQPEGDALVLVHGFSASLHTWEPWVAELGDTYRIISLDLPGHGLSRTPEDGLMNPGYFGEAIADLTSRLGIDRFILAGNSMGGATAWQFALEYPDRLDGLILVDASGWPDPDNQSQPLVFKLLDISLARTLMRDLDMTALVKSGLEDSFYEPGFVTEQMIERYTAFSRAPGHRRGILAMTANRQARIAANDELLGQITAPTLILQGREDKLVSASGAEKFAAAISGSELIIYDRIGHLPQEEIPARSAGDVRAFLTRRIWPAPEPTADTVSGPPDATSTP